MRAGVFIGGTKSSPIFAALLLVSFHFVGAVFMPSSGKAIFYHHSNLNLMLTSKKDYIFTLQLFDLIDLSITVISFLDAIRRAGHSQHGDLCLLDAQCSLSGDVICSGNGRCECATGSWNGDSCVAFDDAEGNVEEQGSGEGKCTYITTLICYLY